MSIKRNGKGRPTKKEQAAIAVRDKEIVEMYDKNYPLDYLSTYFGLSKARIVNIYKKNKLTGTSPDSKSTDASR